MKSDTVHIGVDVSKEKLDIYVPAKKEGSRPLTKEVDNDIKGFRELRDLARKAKATVCVEPTGGYELELIAFMHKFDVPVAYTDALRVRQFARAEGSLSKNDAIDAALISRFADKIGVRVLEAQEVEAVELKRKAKFRQTMVDSRTAMINRLETEIDPEMKALLKEQIRLAGRIIDKAERLCLDTVKKNDRMNSLKERFTAIGGVGDLTAISILSSLPEIGTLSNESDHAQDAVAPEPDRKRSELHAETGARVDEAECQCRTKKESCVALVSGRWFPFLLLPRTPSSSLLSLPCADAQGWNSTLLDNARKFRMKFTVADPLDHSVSSLNLARVSPGAKWSRRRRAQCGVQIRRCPIRP